MNKNEYTIGNKDDLEKALEGLGQFCHNWCMNCKKTEEEDDLCFRCSECNFSQKDGTCAIKTFIKNHAQKENYGKYNCMS